MGNAASQHTELPNGARITTSALSQPRPNDDDPSHASHRDRQRSREQNMAETLLSSPRRRRTRRQPDENVPPSAPLAPTGTQASSRTSTVATPLRTIQNMVTSSFGLATSEHRRAMSSAARPVLAPTPTTPLRPIQNTVLPRFGLATPDATQDRRVTSSTAPGSGLDGRPPVPLNRRAQAQRECRARERAQRQALQEDQSGNRNENRRQPWLLTPPATQPPIAAREPPTGVGIMTPPQTQARLRASHGRLHNVH